MKAAARGRALERRGQNSRAIGASSPRPRPRGMVKTRRSTPHAGGRPLKFIPAAVVARAAELAAYGFSFSTVVRSLEREGNGTWPRRTLLRRVRSTSSSSAPARGQNHRHLQLAGGELEQLERVAKTKTWARLEAAAAAAEFGTPAYHQAIAAMHASPENPDGPGPCGCYSCGFVKRPRGRRR